MKKIHLSVLKEAPCDQFLIDLFDCSKNFLKDSFQKDFLKKQLRSKTEITIPVDFANDKRISPVYSAPLKPAILAETDLFLAVHKPMGIHSAPLRYSDENCLHAWLRENNHFHALNVNREEYNRGLLNRLDFETSGVLIFAKDEDVYQKIRKSFSSYFLQKYYYAVVEGRPEVRGELKNFLFASGKKGKKVMIGDGESNAHLSYETIASNATQSLLKVKLGTGHRHQIRVQLAHLGHPIVGDELYGNAGQRLYLHAYEYALIYEGKEYLFQDTQLDDFKKLFPNFLNLNS